MKKLFLSFRTSAPLVGPVAPWKPGDAFRKVTGKSIAECKTIDDIDAAVAEALNLKGPLPFATSGGNTFVVRNGDVFPHAADSADGIAKRLDSAISDIKI